MAFLVALVHLLTAGLSVPMVRRRVRPNPLYGFRTPATLASERVWYEANAAAGRLMLGATILSALASLVAYRTMPTTSFVTFSLTFFTVAVLVATAGAFWALRRITR